MKKMIFACLCLLSFHLPAQNYQETTDSLFINCARMKTLDPFEDYIEKLSLLPNAANNRYLNYWKAYARYREAVLALQFGQQSPDDRKTGAKAISDAVRILDGTRHKTAEDYALLAACKNLSVGFCKSMRIPLVSAEAKRYAETALKMDPQNLRAWLALGTRDYHTPSMYGGGKQFEEDFLKALSLEDTYSSNPYDPSWGRDEVYYYLCRHYLRTDVDKAIFHLKNALKLYPDNERLLSLIK